MLPPKSKGLQEIQERRVSLKMCAGVEETGAKEVGEL